MIVLCLFCLELLVCVALGWPIVAALLVGLVLFAGWALRQGYGLRAVGGMLWSGIRTAKNVLIVFLLIGVLTALWRACGTVPLLICYAVDLIHPGTLVITSFLLTSAVSALMGTSFGAAATMGAVCMTAAASMGVSPVLAGGAVLSGVFFGDRCLPVSTSALLISELTHTDIYDNLRAMVRTAFVPFALTCAVYAVLGAMAHGGGAAQDVRTLFARVCTLHWLALLPAALILVLSALHVHVRWVMCASIAAAFTLCLTLQHQPLAEVLRCMLTGYAAPDAAAGALLNGGGVVSMLRVTAIVCISAAYSGIFQATGLLGTAKAGIARMSRRITPFGAMLCTAIAASMIACNQTLSILLTHQLCADTEPDGPSCAIDLENSVVVLAPLVPWSIAGAVPLASAGAPEQSLLAACYLYLIPLCSLVWKLLRRRRVTA